MRRLINTTIADPTVDRDRRELATAVDRLQRMPVADARIVSNVRLDDGIETPVAHGLGRPARWVRESCPRDPVTVGTVEEVRTGAHDRKRFVVLKASGWGGSIVVDVLVV